jgi:hypothetical protein
MFFGVVSAPFPCRIWWCSRSSRMGTALGWLRGRWLRSIGAAKPFPFREERLRVVGPVPPRHVPCDVRVAVLPEWMERAAVRCWCP